MNYFIFILVLINIIYAKDANQWQSRSIYQILTDRFAGTQTACTNLQSYCGGTFAGITSQLDYIKDMGFDAIWMSPVVANKPNGYHGYWAEDLYTINPQFGTEQSLKDLITAAHAKDIYVMVDVAPNHMGTGTRSSNKPFNKDEYFHNNCQVTDDSKCLSSTMVNCELMGLPDLNHENPEVRSILNNWIKDLIKNYSFDGIRIDATKHMAPDFLAEFSKSSGVYSISEILDSSDCQKSYLYGEASEGLLHTLGESAIRQALIGGSMTTVFQNLMEQLNYPQPTRVHPHVDSHDTPRFLNLSGATETTYKTAITWLILSGGPPVFYYGSEQLLSGGQDPTNREPLWKVGYAYTSTFNFTSTLNYIRKTYQLWKYPQIPLYSSQSTYIFSRGPILVVLPNTQQQQAITLEYHPFKAGAQLCEMQSSVCINVTSNRQITISASANARVYYPADNESMITTTNKLYSPIIPPSLSIWNLIIHYRPTTAGTWGIHLWGNAYPSDVLNTISWAQPYSFTCNDTFGFMTAVIPIQSPLEKAYFIIHAGDTKSCSQDIYVIPGNTPEIWLIQDDCITHTQPPQGPTVTVHLSKGMQFNSTLPSSAVCKEGNGIFATFSAASNISLPNCSYLMTTESSAWIGTDCSPKYQPQCPCKNMGICVERINGIQCRCKFGSKGELCNNLTTAIIHFLPRSRYSKWGLHLWGDAYDASELVNLTWANPRKFDNVDDFGMVANLKIKNPSADANFIIHIGDVKACANDQKLRASNESEIEIWIIEGDCYVYTSKPKSLPYVSRLAIHYLGYKPDVMFQVNFGSMFPFPNMDPYGKLAVVDLGSKRLAWVALTDASGNEICAPFPIIPSTTSELWLVEGDCNTHNEIITSVDFCSLQPCLNGGLCSSYVGGRICSCTAKFTGFSCEKSIPEPVVPQVVNITNTTIRQVVQTNLIRVQMC